MQSRLPDINTAFVKYRNIVTTHLEMQDYTACFGALYALNGLLPDEYRVKISTTEYNKLTRHDIFVKCNSCQVETDYSKIKVFDLIIPLIETVISGNQHEKVWLCSSCKHKNKLLKTEMRQTVLQEPYYLHVVPSPGKRRDGLNDRSSYHRKIAVWVWTMIDELEERMSMYREDNWQKDERLELDQSTGDD